ncbi:MAG: anti-sigma factor [Paraglaciecola sp.]|uniref:anti-sigma factor n=1 Tax=Paraglaciecola sp. TaxID=1920173 RepID=UPI00273E5EA0|nr:anti-sigma factor [Paraglaciecola sp.]MDP5030874.1 anti-sigma factor [Paraglaciecola sp.]MDP5131054.1 anti-sigma factor [Paraglaciecola sp.]
MNYLIQPRRDALAAEYVLGTLRGAARLRFQRLILQYPAIRSSVEQWEQHINALGGQIQPVAPDPAVWEKIKQRLAFANAQVPESNVVAFPSKVVSRWKALSLLASAAAVVLAVLLVQLQPIEPEPAQQFTVMQNEAKESLWLIEITTKTIEAYATKNVSQRQQNDYQLWMIAEDGRPPISLGLLPQSGLVSLSKHPQFDQLDIAALAVSLEPLGGSPNGSPTEVLYVAELALL